MNAYLISGLGADKRIFARLRFPDSVKVHHLDWLEPLNHESISDYALRMAEGIDKSNPFFLLGLSFGGMVATEIAKRFPPVRLVLLSSAAVRGELPLPYRLAGHAGIHKLVPFSIFCRPSRLANWFFGASDQDTRKLLSSIIRDTKPAFLTWAVDQIVNWKNSTLPSTLIQIHGTDDRVIWPAKKQNTEYVSGAGHLMVFTDASAVSARLGAIFQGLV